LPKTTDELSCLLQTIEELVTAKRFVQAQDERRRIPYGLIVDLARQEGWTDLSLVRVFTAPPTSVECAAA
jgi:hypothetical protein